MPFVWLYDLMEGDLLKAAQQQRADLYAEAQTRDNKEFEKWFKAIQSNRQERLKSVRRVTV